MTASGGPAATLEKMSGRIRFSFERARHATFKMRAYPDFPLALSPYTTLKPDVPNASGSFVEIIFTF
jgi:hypothetical protein